MNEQELIQQFKAGQKECFGELYDLHFQKIYNHIFYKTLDQLLTEDIVSDTFFKAFDNIHQFVYKAEGSFLSWLYTIANNLLKDFYKKKKSDQLNESRELESNENITNELHNRYTSEQIVEKLNELGSEKRDLILMRLWEGLSYEQISEITGRSNVSLRKDYSTTLKELRILLPELGILIALLLIQLPIS